MTTLITLLGKHLREGYEMKSKDTLSVSNEIAITSGRRYSHIPKRCLSFSFYCTAQKADYRELYLYL